MFFSLEQTGVMAYERFVMMEGLMESHQVEGWSKQPDGEIKKRLGEALQTLHKNFNNFILVDDSGMSLEKIENYALQAGLKLFGKAPRVLVIDYLGYIQGEGKDMYHRISDISRSVKELAKRLNCVIVLLCQVSKAGKTGGDPLEGYHARDSGVVMESADILITAWRPELQEDLSDDEKEDLKGVYMTKIAKNKYGEGGRKIEFTFVKKHLKLLERRDNTLTVDKDGKIISGTK